MMPEGPEVRTVVDQLRAGIGMRFQSLEIISGRYRRNGPPDGYKEFLATLSPLSEISAGKGDVDLIKDWNCKGKFIYVVLDDGGSSKQLAQNGNDFKRSIWITLGMSGRFVSESSNQLQSTDPRWCISLCHHDGKCRKIFYHDPRNFGTLKFSLSAKALANKLNSLGPDILDRNFTQESFLQIISAQKPNMNICKFLMNQRKISGIGNYILAEGLYRAKIDPFCSLSELSQEQQRLLLRELQATANLSYLAQGLSRQGGAYRDVDGNRGQFEFQLQCYGRQVCARGKAVEKELNGPHGRTIWYTEDQLFVPRIMRFGGVDVMVEGQDEEMDDERDTKQKEASGFDYRIATLENDNPVEVRDVNEAQLVDPADSVRRLTAGLKDEGWRNVLKQVVDSEKFRALADFLDQERKRGATIYPPQQDIFAALNLCSLNSAKVVIVGQDPYHGRGQGNGLAFSVNPGIPLPPSLMNIFKEAQRDVGIDLPSHGNLQCWAEQGVLLLNTVLTVREGEPNSHAKKGWEEFTDAVIDALNNREEALIFLLWGNPAHTKASNVDEHRHVIIRTSHPSPLGASKTKLPFLGSRCFSRANEALIDNGKAPIDWNVS